MDAPNVSALMTPTWYGSCQPICVGNHCKHTCWVLPNMGGSLHEHDVTLRHTRDVTCIRRRLQSLEGPSATTWRPVMPFVTVERPAAGEAQPIKIGGHSVLSPHTLGAPITLERAMSQLLFWNNPTGCRHPVFRQLRKSCVISEKQKWVNKSRCGFGSTRQGIHIISTLSESRSTWHLRSAYIWCCCCCCC